LQSAKGNFLHDRQTSLREAILYANAGRIAPFPPEALFPYKSCGYRLLNRSFVLARRIFFPGCHGLTFAVSSFIVE